MELSFWNSHLKLVPSFHINRDLIEAIFRVLFKSLSPVFLLTSIFLQNTPILRTRRWRIPHDLTQRTLDVTEFVDPVTTYFRGGEQGRRAVHRIDLDVTDRIPCDVGGVHAVTTGSDTIRSHTLQARTFQRDWYMDNQLEL